MRVIFITVIAAAMSSIPEVMSQQHALFVKRDSAEHGKRVTRQTSADQMVQNILQWLQGVYAQNSRKIRQGSFREYLPPSNTQKPRPFEPSGQNGEDNFIGYPANGITPQPPFPPAGNNIYQPGRPGYMEPKPFPPKTTTRPDTSTGYPEAGYPKPTPGFPTGNNGYTTENNGIPGSNNGYPGSNNGYPSGNNGYPTPGPSTGYPGPTTGYPGPTTSYPRPTTGYPGPTTGYPGPVYTSGRPEQSTPVPEYPTTEYPSNGYPTGPPTTYPTQPGKYPTATYPSATNPPPTGTYPSQTEEPVYPPGQIVQTDYPNVPTEEPVQTTNNYYTEKPTSKPSYTTSNPTDKPLYTSARPSYTSTGPTYTSPRPTFTSEKPGEKPTGKPGDSESTGSEVADDLKHPPHIHEINVECAKDMMTINIEFNRPFDGIIYSKGYFNNPDCRYVQENSGEVKYSFTVSLNSCGTEFINAFDTEGQSYLENVLVLQNEAGIQEVWDTIRSVRCLWEGNLNKALSVALSVGMLTQEIVTFSGDTAMARLDIQMGKGPFAPTANGLVKIGETMTLVVSVTGDPGFDIHVRDCQAKDNSGENSVVLTDDNGCVLKPKLMGAFQKTRDTGNTGASIIAYSFFNAFKFPDIMDLMIECNVELCKTDCEVCPNPDQKYEPGRRRKRDLQRFNGSLGDPVTLGKALRVILPEDLSTGEAIINLTTRDEVCVSTFSFVISAGFLMSLLTSSMFVSGYLWLKNQRLVLQKV